MTTRFRPTPTCDLHIGHLWVAWHNWEDARRGGDRFLVIIDDICYNLQNVWRAKWSPPVWARRFAEDLAWAGVEADDVLFSTRNADAHAAAADKAGFSRCGLSSEATFATRAILGRDMISPPIDAYHEWLTLTRVVDDHEFGVQCFTRGMDLVGERQLYDHIWRRLYDAGLPPRQTYVPVVRRALSQVKESTSSSAPSVRQLREAGYTPRELLETIRECARLSALAGSMDVVIPEGVLTLEAHKAIPFRGDALLLRSDMAYNAKEPWATDVTATVNRYIERMGWEVESEPSQ